MTAVLSTDGVLLCLDANPFVVYKRQVLKLSYRIYFARQGRTLLLLLGGGDKSSQARDIRMAKQLLADWRE